MNIICVLWNGWTAVAAIATGLSAIATAIMVGMTMRSLSQNKAQLAEMKKQFEEENRARLLFEIVSYQNTFLLKIANIGNTTAYDVNINIKSKLIDEHFSDEIKSYFEQTNKKNHIMAPLWCLDLFISPNHSTLQTHTIGGKTYSSDQTNKWLETYQNEKIFITGKYCRKYEIQEEFSISDFIGKSLIVHDSISLVLQDISREITESNKNQKLMITSFNNSTTYFKQLIDDKK